MRIGLLGAMAEEVEELLECMQMEQRYRYASMDFYLGTLEGQSVVLACSGIGKVNAAAAVQCMVDRFGIDCLLFTGIAGGVDPALNVGDIVISEDAMQHDFDSSAFGYDRGRIPRLKKKLFYADRHLIKRFLSSGKKLVGVNSHIKVIPGRILSGDQFIASTEITADLYRLFGGHCVEMEGAAAAHVCALNQIPYVIIRSISDRADHSARVDYRAFAEQAVARSCWMVRDVLKNWSDDMD